MQINSYHFSVNNCGEKNTIPLENVASGSDNVEYFVLFTPRVWLVISDRHVKVQRRKEMVFFFFFAI